MRQPELLDFAEVKAQVLRALRGRRSAAAMSKRLGLSPNQFSRWETSQRVLKWREFQLVCAGLRLNLKATFTSLFGYRGDVGSFADLMTSLAPGQQRAHIAETLGVSQQMLNRWYAGSASPRIELVFKAINDYTHLLEPFLAKLVDLKAWPSLTEALSALPRFDEILAHDQLWVPVYSSLAVRSYLDLPQHRSGVIAKLCGISELEERRLLKDMAAAGLVRLVDGKYRQTKALDVDLPIDPRSLEVSKFWSTRVLRRFAARDASESLYNDRDLMTLLVAPLSDEAIRKIKTMYMELYRNIRLVAQNDMAPPERVHLIVLHSVDVAQLGGRQETGCVI